MLGLATREIIVSVHTYHSCSLLMTDFFLAAGDDILGLFCLFHLGGGGGRGCGCGGSGRFLFDDSAVMNLA